jgi:glycolate oxidase FAD binding subunit
MSGLASLPARFENLLGSNRVHAADSDLRDFAIGGRVPRVILKPGAAEEVAEAVRFAATEKLALVACGSRSKLEIGMPPRQYDIALDMTDLRQIVHYDPDDLTLSVDAGIPLSELASALAQRKQFLPLAVPFLHRSTAGGAIASGIDSSLRLQYGTARDFLIGAEFVDGKGQLCKSGGRVVKNVTGYDLHKLLIGSLGTLAVITRLNFRTFPLPELLCGCMFSFAALETAQAFHSAVSLAGLPLSNLEMLDPVYSELFAATFRNEHGVPLASWNPAEWTVFVAFEGNQAVVDRISHDLQKYAHEAGALRAEMLATVEGQRVATLLRETFHWLRMAAPATTIIRIALPQFGAEDIQAFLGASREPQVRPAFLLRACNVAYLALLAQDDGEHERTALQRIVSEILSRAGAKQGAATLLHAPQWLKDRVNPWGLTRSDFPLMQRVKQAFDPQSLFAPGRFVGGL